MPHLADSPACRQFPGLKQIPDTLLRYVAALGLLAGLVGVAYLLLLVFGRGASLVFVLFYFIAIAGSAWLGYGPGVLVSTLMTYAVAPIFSTRPFHASQVDLRRFAMLLVISLLVSRIAQMVRRRQDELMHAAEELERRVLQRTEEAMRSADAKREAEHSLLEKAQLLELAHDAILSLDFDGTIRFWNWGAEQIYGWTRAEALGKCAHDLLKTVFPSALKEIEIRVVARGHWEGELIHTRRDGVQLQVMSRWALRKGEEGEPVGFLEINTDITEKRRIEEQLRHTQKLESLGVLAGGVAHDFNNLLTGILGNASLALDGLPSNHSNRVLLEEVMRASERAADLTRQLLAYAGKGRFVMRTLNLSDMVREISGLVQTSVPKQVQIRHQLSENLPGIDADPGQLQQIVMNLVINGAEAIGPEGGSVLVRTGIQPVDDQYIDTMSSAGELLVRGDYVSLEVHDTGSGMNAETLAKIFDPFFTTKFAGRGLGLSAVLGIVRAHKGALKVYSQPGQGTTFKVLFPASTNRVINVAPSYSGSLAGTGTVLVVDDEEIVRQTATHTLQRYGYRTVTAESGSTAVELYKRQANGIVLVLLDLTMPGVSGEEALRQLQMINSKVRVLLSSGYNEVEAVQRFSGKGLAGFIQKPYTAAALAEKVKEVLAE
jgi:PAS domain S-box-containing protein